MEAVEAAAAPPRGAVTTQLAQADYVCMEGTIKDSLMHFIVAQYIAGKPDNTLSHALFITEARLTVVCLFAYQHTSIHTSAEGSSITLNHEHQPASLVKIDN